MGEEMGEENMNYNNKEQIRNFIHFFNRMIKYKIGIIFKQKPQK